MAAPTKILFCNAVQLKKKIYLTNNAQQWLDIGTDYDIANFIQCDYTALPLMCESVDVALVHHALEFAQNPRTILEEISQALAPHGHLIIIGFNPSSLFGLQRHFADTHDLTMLKQLRFISAKHIKNWLEQLGFAVTCYTTCYFYPRSQNMKATQKIHTLEKMGRLLNSKHGACYIFVAKKRTIGVTPIKTRALAHRLSFGYLKPSPQINRSQNQSQ